MIDSHAPRTEMILSDTVSHVARINLNAIVNVLLHRDAYFETLALVLRLIVPALQADRNFRKLAFLVADSEKVLLVFAEKAGAYFLDSYRNHALQVLLLYVFF